MDSSVLEANLRGAVISFIVVPIIFISIPICIGLILAAFKWLGNPSLGLWKALEETSIFRSIAEIISGTVLFVFGLLAGLLTLIVFMALGLYLCQYGPYGFFLGVPIILVGFGAACDVMGSCMTPKPRKVEELQVATRAKEEGFCTKEERQTTLYGLVEGYICAYAENNATSYTFSPLSKLLRKGGFDYVLWEDLENQLFPFLWMLADKNSVVIERGRWSTPCRNRLVDYIMDNPELKQFIPVIAEDIKDRVLVGRGVHRIEKEKQEAEDKDHIANHDLTVFNESKKN